MSSKRLPPDTVIDIEEKGDPTVPPDLRSTRGKLEVALHSNIEQALNDLKEPMTENGKRLKQLYEELLDGAYAQIMGDS